MGISGLLPLLKSIHKSTTLKKFAGQTIGIDGYGWLHRGAIACAIELALDKPTTKFVDFAMSRVRMLLAFGVIPYVIFDGDNLPSKAGTNDERRKRRNEAKALGLSLYKAGKTAQAYQELQKATGVTPQMARQLIEELKRLNVQYIVAPYEADAQLAYLERKGIIDGILSEDSDLLVFGAKRLITKLNQYGECVEIERADFPLCKDISLTGWSDAMFRRMAILSGCDYLPNIDKMGLKTAYRFVRKYKDPEKTIRMIAFEGKYVVPQGYLEKFQQAELTFIHHRVFCPIQQKMVFLTDLDRGMSEIDMPYLGPHVEPETAIGVACGDLNPKDKQPIEVKSVAAARPSLRDNRRQTMATPTDLKKSTSLENFFKPRRTPLQELDPNSLTPSPSQQRLLARNRNASWEPRTVSSAPQLRRMATVAAPSSNNTERRAFLARASTISNYQPPKRQRLCSEVDDLTPSKEVKHSPFFSSALPAMSPLDLKKLRTHKSAREFDVWSDDSVNDALLDLAEQNDTATNIQKSVSIVEEVDVAATQTLESIPQSSPMQSFEESQGPQFSDSGTQSQLLFRGSGAVSQNTVVGSIYDDDDVEAFEDLLEYHVRKQNESIAKTFASQSTQCRNAALAGLASPQKCSSPDASSGNATPSIARPVQGKIFTQVVKDEIAVPPKSTSSATSRLLQTFAYQPTNVQTAALQSLSKVQTDAEKIDLAKAALTKERKAEASSQNQTRTKSMEQSRGLAAKTSNASLQGSEDALVPNSDDDDDVDEVSSAGEETLKPKFSLGGFAFTG